MADMAEKKSASKRRAKGWERKKANRDTQQEILKAAALAWAKDGFEGASLVEIAKRVGIKAPSLYNHFKSKNQILFTFIKEYGEGFLADIQEKLDQAGDDPRERLAVFLRQHILYELEHLEVMPLVNSFFEGKPGFAKALRPAQRQSVIGFQREVVDTIQGILEDGRKAGIFAYSDITTASYALLGMVENVVYWFKRGGRLKENDVAEHIAQLGLKSILTK
jgi:AcrR family transcriptional regulator